MAIRFDDIGNRLKAFRLAAGLSADQIAKRLQISRAALYRFEKGELAKIETLDKLAELLGVSVPTLLGVGVEYLPSAVAYFERLRQLEETASHVIVLAGPISYLLSSDAFHERLARVLEQAKESRQVTAGCLVQLARVYHARNQPSDARAALAAAAALPRSPREQADYQTTAALLQRDLR